MALWVTIIIIITITVTVIAVIIIMSIIATTVSTTSFSITITNIFKKHYASLFLFKTVFIRRQSCKRGQFNGKNEKLSIFATQRN